MAALGALRLLVLLLASRGGVASPPPARRVHTTFESVERLQEGGLRVRASVGGHIQYFDPFLLFADGAFAAARGGGFPDHAHCGFQGLSLVLGGAVRLEDSLGTDEVAREGEGQLLTTCLGVLHSEMPEGSGETRLLQMWVNLPAAEKRCEPSRQRLAPLPLVAEGGDANVTVVLGSFGNATAPARPRWPATLLRVSLAPRAAFRLPVAADWNALAFVTRGSLALEHADGTPLRLRRAHTALFAIEGEAVETRAGRRGAEFFVAAARVVNEVVAFRSGLSLSSQQELDDALADSRQRRNAFPNWESRSARARREEAAAATTTSQSASFYDEL
jgi:redox-sensitive bicupin YhaK (pirin superfamily)